MPRNRCCLQVTILLVLLFDPRFGIVLCTFSWDCQPSWRYICTCFKRGGREREVLCFMWLRCCIAAACWLCFFPLGVVRCQRRCCRDLALHSARLPATLYGYLPSLLLLPLATPLKNLYLPRGRHGSKIQHPVPFPSLVILLSPSSLFVSCGATCVADLPLPRSDGALAVYVQCIACINCEFSRKSHLSFFLFSHVAFYRAFDVACACACGLCTDTPGPPLAKDAPPPQDPGIYGKGGAGFNAEPMERYTKKSLLSSFTLSVWMSSRSLLESGNTPTL